jgi:8-oxo-dGTP pyrophosphatase MutT (NUDIX family)
VPSATVVLLRGGVGGFQVLLVRRNDKLAFHGGAWVFPGGRVDPCDAQGVPVDGLAAARRAAHRETWEETGLTVSVEVLVPMALWTTPPGRARRFRTWFFLARGAGGEVRVDGAEIRDHRWMQPAEAIRAHRQGEMVLPPPTFVTLAKLSRHTAADVAFECHAQRDPEVFTPRPRQVPGGAVSLYEGDVAYGGGDLDERGPHHRLWMLGTDWRYERAP